MKSVDAEDGVSNTERQVRCFSCGRRNGNLYAKGEQQIESEAAFSGDRRVASY